MPGRLPLAARRRATTTRADRKPDSTEAHRSLTQKAKPPPSSSATQPDSTDTRPEGWVLRQARYHAVGLAATTAVYHARPSPATSRSLGKRRRSAALNQE